MDEPHPPQFQIRLSLWCRGLVEIQSSCLWLSWLILHACPFKIIVAGCFGSYIKSHRRSLYLPLPMASFYWFLTFLLLASIVAGTSGILRWCLLYAQPCLNWWLHFKTMIWTLRQWLWLNSMHQHSGKISSITYDPPTTLKYFSKQYQNTFSSSGRGMGWHCTDLLVRDSVLA